MIAMKRLILAAALAAAIYPAPSLASEAGVKLAAQIDSVCAQSRYQFCFTTPRWSPTTLIRLDEFCAAGAAFQNGTVENDLCIGLVNFEDEACANPGVHSNFILCQVSRFKGPPQDRLSAAAPPPAPVTDRNVKFQMIVHSACMRWPQYPFCTASSGINIIYELARYCNADKFDQVCIELNALGKE
jgi:hypothetical protein